MELSDNEKVLLAALVLIGLGAGAYLLLRKKPTRRAAPRQLPAVAVQPTQVRQLADGQTRVVPPREPASAARSGGRASLSQQEAFRFQSILRGLDYRVPNSLAVTEAEEDAVERFQAAYNQENLTRSPKFEPEALTVDGKMGPNTQRALEHYSQFATSSMPPARSEGSGGDTMVFTEGEVYG